MQHLSHFSFINRYVPHKVQVFVASHLSTLALLMGFVWDNLTLSQVDAWYDTAVVGAYLLIASGAVFLINVTSIGRFSRISPWLPAAAQFAFGGLFSSYVVYYSRTGSWLGGWPFLLGLVALLIGNEFFKNRYASFVFHTSLLFIAVFSFLIFYVPVLTGTMGAGTFIVSGICALAFISVFFALVRFVAQVRARESVRPLLISIATIYAAFHLLYFTNAIPPLPLSLRELTIAHSVVKTGNTYVVATEVDKGGWIQRLLGTPHVHYVPGGRLYAYSAIFAPGKLRVPVYHEWQYYSESMGEWITKTKVRFPIQGGRMEGYRGYSFKDTMASGKWRIRVTTETGALIGTRSFIVIPVAQQPALVEVPRR
jgi:hypothetical protein